MKPCKQLSRAFCEFLEGRQLLSASFSNADMSGLWGLSSMGAEGSVQFDGAGGIVGGSVVDDSGEQNPVTGSYSITSVGKVTITSEDVLSGAMNASKDVTAVSATGLNSLTVLVNGGGRTFSNADLRGTWNLFVNGDQGNDNPKRGNFTDDSGHGTIIFNGAGKMSVLFTADESGRKESLNGTYSVSTDGSVTVSIPKTEGKIYVGQLNKSKDLVAVNPTDLAGAASDNDSRVLVIVKRGGKFSNASMNGTWALVVDKGIGTITFNGDGRLTGTLLTNDGKNTLSGTYVLASDGTFNATIIAKDKNGTFPTSFTGVISATRDVVVMDRPNAGEEGLDDMATIINSAGAPAATVSVIANLPKASEVKGSTTGKGEYTVTRTGDVNVPLTVRYSLGGSATNGVDYALLSGMVTFAVGKSTATIDVKPVSDGIVEGAENVVLAITADGTGAYKILKGKGNAKVTIADASK
jgi:hypothetical protein